ncbi:MAG TPA: tyrosine-type recombinase/integrase [Segeticoccus sp.]|uniref:tyrosine-type recombinase/integrase n=1 Tax=Segeticoccus sp. TaxID=2706531 RepID=UPI002D7F1C2B|nr:tyrosine-type recombinase/integrase [Segeticoccus sp.]HET8599447.1 tyrosine-type recombinase/integrase [Segeticoccus sp.]
MAKATGKRGFGQITKLPSGRHRARYTGPDAALHNAPYTFNTREDAEAWLAGERRLISTGAWTAVKARAQEVERNDERRRQRTFAAYAQSWLDGRHDLRPTTRTSYAASLNRHLLPWFADMLLDEITRQDVRAWFSSYGQRTPTARAHAYQVLGSIMRQAEDDEFIPRSPCRIRSGGRSTVKREAEVLTLSELLALAEAMPAQHRAMTLLCGLCGLRFGEAAALRRRDVDLGRCELRVVRTAIRAGGTKSAGPPKTVAGKRTVAMPALVVEALRGHLSHLPGADRDALVFPGRDGQLLAPSALYGRAARTERRDGRTYEKRAYGFFAAREAIGKPGLHWHDLRRTAATLGAQSGATVREMQSRLGHSTPNMALYYQGATAERDRAIADRLQAQVDALRGDATARIAQEELAGQAAEQTAAAP